MGFEEIFTYIGQFGHYQMFLFLMLGLPSLFTGYQNMAMVSARARSLVACML
jgi:hypothetical protein